MVGMQRTQRAVGLGEGGGAGHLASRSSHGVHFRCLPSPRRRPALPRNGDHDVQSF